MERKRNFETKLEKFLTGKGFYIVLFLCIAVIGVSAWVMLFSDDVDEPGSVAVFDTAQEDNLDAIAQKPETQEKKPSVKEEKEEPVKADKPTIAETKPVQTVVNEEKPAVTENEEPAVTVTAPTAFIWPVAGEVIGQHSVDALVYNKTMEDWRTHCGIDIAADLGATVKAVADGTVTRVYEDDLFGTTIVIDHGAGVISVYSNMASKPVVKEGDKVSLGSVIGSVGTTALAETCEVHHLHFEMKVNEMSADPTDYLPMRLS